MTEVNEQDTIVAPPASGESAGSGDHIPVSTFEVVPYGQTTNEKELYSFREAMAPPPVEPEAKKQVKPAPPAKLLAVLGISALVAISAYGLYAFVGLKSNVSYTDFGSQRFDPAGLSGRLITRWAASGTYQLYLDPIGPNNAANFAAVAADPPRQISFTIRLLDAKGLVACQKQILFPAPDLQAQDGGSSVPQAPQPSETGDSRENMTDQKGQISEIDVRGPLPCPEKAFATFKSWDFTADFPTAAEEEEWHRQEKTASVKPQRNSGGQRVRIERSLGPIEGDDVIVADNPSHGTVETSGGRTFFLGAGERNRTAEWQVFPAAIHFRCDRNGACALTRSNSSLALQARLLK
ncbi:MAG: hypothetical protein ACRD3S_19065 [Terracidiphilus sp.]